MFSYTPFSYFSHYDFKLLLQDKLISPGLYAPILMNFLQTDNRSIITLCCKEINLHQLNPYFPTAHANAFPHSKLPRILTEGAQHNVRHFQNLHL